MLREKLLSFALIGLLAGGTACTAEVDDTGSLPDVDVRGGSMPDIDVQPADIDITTDTQTVTVPRIDVNPRDTVRDTLR